MACSCKDKSKAKPAAAKVTIQLAGGTKIVKNSADSAAAFVANHPGAKILP